MANQIGVKSAMKHTVSKYENEQRKKFADVCLNTEMPYPDFLTYAENEIKQSKRMATFNYKLLCFKDDGVYQLNRAIEDKFGVVAASKNDNPSGGDDTVQTIEVSLADGRRIKVPYGDIDLSELGEGSVISISYNSDNHTLYIKGKCQFKFTSLIDEIIDETKYLLATDSIYKNQALEITDLNSPLIMNLSNIEAERMILSESTEIALRPLEARIMHPQRCIERGIPLKYGVLLEGKYGTGKTLIAFKTAIKAIRNNWAFIYLKDPKLLAETLRMCKVIDRTGHGVVVFCEDIDQVTRGTRDEAMQDILNTLDGGDTKGMNVITVFTTNHIELIEPTFLRGKRIGSIISLGGLDAKTAEIFVKESFNGSFVMEGDFSNIYKMIEEKEIVPAFMAEIIEAVKSNMLFADDPNKLVPIYLENSVKSYLSQVNLAKTKDMSVTTEQAYAENLRKMLGIDKIKKELSEIKNNM